VDRGLQLTGCTKRRAKFLGDFGLAGTCVTASTSFTGTLRRRVGKRSRIRKRTTPFTSENAKMIHSRPDAITCAAFPDRRYIEISEGSPGGPWLTATAAGEVIGNKKRPPKVGIWSLDSPIRKFSENIQREGRFVRWFGFRTKSGEHRFTPPFPTYDLQSAPTLYMLFDKAGTSEAGRAPRKATSANPKMGRPFGDWPAALRTGLQ